MGAPGAGTGKVGVLDLGSNSFHGAWYGRRPGWGLEGLARLGNAKRMVRLASGLAPHGRLDDDAVARALRAVREICAEAPVVAPLVAVATSAVREADNGGAFVAAAEEILEHRVTVLSGREEAHFGYLGARAALPPGGRVVVLDLGGGSVQIACGDGAAPSWSASLPLGVLRVRDRLLGPGGDGSAARLDRDVRLALEALIQSEAAEVAREVVAYRPAHVVFASGTARMVGRLVDDLGLAPVSRWASGTRIPARALRLLASMLARLRAGELVGLGVEPGRADTIAVGALTLDRFLALFGRPEAVVAATGLREGLALDALGLVGPARDLRSLALRQGQG